MEKHPGLRFTLGNKTKALLPVKAKDLATYKLRAFLGVDTVQDRLEAGPDLGWDRHIISESQSCAHPKMPIFAEQELRGVPAGIVNDAQNVLSGCNARCHEVGAHRFQRQIQHSTPKGL